MSLAKAFDRFDKKNLACRVPVGQTGQFSSVSKAKRDVLRTYMRAAVGRAVGLHPKDPALMAVDIRPLAAVLPEMAYRDATILNRSKPSNEASGVRLFLRAVTGDKIPGRTYKRRVSPESFLPEWRPLADAVWDSGIEQPGNFGKYAGWLETMQNVALLNGVRCPQDLPDYTTVSAWLTAHEAAAVAKTKTNSDHTIDERAAKRCAAIFTAYRKSRDLLGNPADLPPLVPPPQPSHRGVQALPDLDARLRERALQLRAEGAVVPEILPTAQSDTLAILDLLAPEISKATRTYLEWTTTTAARSQAWRDSVVRAASTTVAEMIRLGEDAATLDYPDLFLQTREIAKTTPALALGLKRAVHLVDRQVVPLIRVVIDAATIRSFANSPMTLPSDQLAAAVPMYTAAVFNNIFAIWAVTKQVYGKQLGMATQSPDDWRRIEHVDDDLLEHMQEYNDAREIEGFKDKSLVTANWGQAVCIGGLLLWRRARECRAAWEQAVAEHGPDSPVGRRARRSYNAALKNYVLWVVLLDDGLRIRNYAGARVSRHLRFTTEIVDGKRRITAVTTTFAGYDREAGPKKKRKATGSQNKRIRSLNPGVVDFELLTDFVYMSRIDDLVSAGLLPSPDAFDPDADSFALFVSPQSTRPHGGYLTSRLSKRWGRLLHWLMRDILGHVDPDGNPIPTWTELRRSKPLRRKWRAIWDAHILRQLIATFFVGVLKDEDTACRLTNDTPATLRAFYNQFDDTLAESMKGPRGVNHPEHFAEVCRRLTRGEIVDWASFDPEHPEDAKWVSQQQSLPAPKRRRSRRPRYQAGASEKQSHEQKPAA